MSATDAQGAGARQPPAPGARLLEVSDLKKHFPLKGGLLGGTTGYVYAVDGVSFHIARGETLSLVGESGCGKSTVGKAVLRLFDITSGQVVLDGKRIDDLSTSALRPMRRRVQVVMRVKGVKRVSVGQGGEGSQGVVVGVVEGEGTAGHAQAEAAQSGATIQVGVGE